MRASTITLKRTHTFPMFATQQLTCYSGQTQGRMLCSRYTADCTASEDYYIQPRERSYEILLLSFTMGDIVMTAFVVFLFESIRIKIPIFTFTTSTYIFFFFFLQLRALCVCQHWSVIGGYRPVCFLFVSSIRACL